MTTTNNKYKEFIASISSIKSQRVYKSYSSLGEFDYTDCDIKLVEKAILCTKPKDIKSITTACNILRRYAEFIGNTLLVKIVNSIDRKELWERIKPDNARKFISNKQYKEICHDIIMWEEHNALYYQTLFMAIYEGIYNKDMSVLKNLRARDIEDNGVILHPDSEDEYFLEISKDLLNNLRELSEITNWEQTARYSNIQLPLVGDFPDTCFKTVRRAEKNEARFYYYRLRKIANDYVERPLRAYELFISGITYRIAEELKDNGITLQEAFKAHSRDKTIRAIFSNELFRCRYLNQVKNFRELIESYLDVFLE